MYKDFPERCFYHVEKFDLYGYLSWKVKCPKILGNEIFISEIATIAVERYLPGNHLLIWNCWVTFLNAKNCKNIRAETQETIFPWFRIF